MNSFISPSPMASFSCLSSSSSSYPNSTTSNNTSANSRTATSFFPFALSHLHRSSSSSSYATFRFRAALKADTAAAAAANNKLSGSGSQDDDGLLGLDINHPRPRRRRRKKKEERQEDWEVGCGQLGGVGGDSEREVVSRLSPSDAENSDSFSSSPDSGLSIENENTENSRRNGRTIPRRRKGKEVGSKEMVSDNVSAVGLHENGGSEELSAVGSSSRDKNELLPQENVSVKAEKSQNSRHVLKASARDDYVDDYLTVFESGERMLVKMRTEAVVKNGIDSTGLLRASEGAIEVEEREDEEMTNSTRQTGSIGSDSARKTQKKKHSKASRAEQVCAVSAQAVGELETTSESLLDTAARNGGKVEVSLEGRHMDKEPVKQKRRGKGAQKSTSPINGSFFNAIPLNYESKTVNEATSPGVNGEDLVEKSGNIPDYPVVKNLSAAKKVVVEAPEDGKVPKRRGKKKSQGDVQAEKAEEAILVSSLELTSQFKTPSTNGKDQLDGVQPSNVDDQLNKLVNNEDSISDSRNQSKQKKTKSFIVENIKDASVQKCLVLWQVEMSPECSHVVCLTGNSPELGSWDPASAITLVRVPDEGNTKNIWEATVPVQYGTKLEYSYFIRLKGDDFNSLVKKPGPPLHFVVPLLESTALRDSWGWYVRKQLPFLPWGNWWEDIASPQIHEEDSKTNNTITEEVAAVEAKESKVVEVVSDVKVEIIINSSECTMQRVAIVEDGKLVQLLLEPVEADVQVGNIYLGIVKQILPGMNGVFIDIGSSRIGLMSLDLERPPYIFPPFGFKDLNSGEKGDVNLSSCRHDEAKLVSEVGDEEEEEEEDDTEGLGIEPEASRDDNNVHDVLHESQEHEDDDYQYQATKQFLSHFCDKEIAEAVLKNDAASQAAEEYPSWKNGHQLPAVVGSNNVEKLDMAFYNNISKWKLEEGMKIVVQVKKEPLGKKGPRLTAFPTLAGRFLVLDTQTTKVGVSKKVLGEERRRLKSIAESLKPVGLGVTMRTAAVGRNYEDLEKDLARVMGTWKEVLDRANAATAAAANGVEGAVPVLLHKAMGQTLRTVRDVFKDEVQKMVVDSPLIYQEVTGYLQEVAPHLCDRVELYTGNVPIFDAFNLETEIDKFSSKRVNLPNGAYLVIEETEALVSIDVNGGASMLGQNTMRMDTVLEVNLAAARQIATELRLRDVGGIIVVDFLNMEDKEHESLLCDEMLKAIQRDPSKVAISEISEHGLMEIIRKRVRPSIPCTISEPCSFCRGTGRVESPEATLSRIEREIKRHIAKIEHTAEVMGNSKWPHVLLRVDPVLFEYLRSRSKKRITQLGTYLKVFINLKVALELPRGQFEVSEMPHSTEKWSMFVAQQKGKHNAISSNILGRKANFVHQKSFGP